MIITMMRMKMMIKFCSTNHTTLDLYSCDMLKTTCNFFNSAQVLQIQLSQQVSKFKFEARLLRNYTDSVMDA